MATDEPIGTRVITNPASGETIILPEVSVAGDDVLAWQLRLAPGGKVPSGHVHPGQQERFTVRAGHVRFRIGGRSTLAGPGAVVTVPAGTRHHFANAGACEARVDVESFPAMRMAELLRTASALSIRPDGRRRLLPRPLDVLLFMHEFRDEVRPPYLPARPVRAVLAWLAWLTRDSRAAERYRRLRAD